MANAANVIGKFKDELEQTGNEIVKDVKDEVGQAIEQGVQSITAPQLTPGQLQQRQQEEQKKEIDRQKQIAYTRKYIQDLTISQQKVRMENKQKEQQRLQIQQQKQRVTEIKREEKKKQPINPATFYAGKAEFKRGVGG